MVKDLATKFRKKDAYKNELLQELEDYRGLKHKGARATNLSAAQDMRFTMQRLSQEVHI